MKKNSSLPSKKEIFEQLKKFNYEFSLLNSIESLISWDQETYMPEKGISIKSNQLSYLSALIHKKTTDKNYKNLLSKFYDLKKNELKKDLLLSNTEKIIIKEYAKKYIKASKLPNQFIEKYSKLLSHSVYNWAKAKKEKDFSLFEKDLQKVIDMSIEKASYLSKSKHPYDTLLDQYEPNITIKQLDHLFNNLKIGLLDLLKKIKKSKEKINTKILSIKVSKEKQFAISKLIMDLMQIDQKKCRLDLSSHPFSTSMSPSDVRMTTRINEKNFYDCISIVMHEGGHSLYELHFDEKYFGTPLCEAISFGIHESQSRFFETLIGKSKPFIKFIFPKLKKIIQDKNFSKLSYEEFYKAINISTPSYIRVEADEITYSLHIILRYEIEKALIEKKMKAKDIPNIWNEKMKKYLGITPKNDALGCLQDVHWSMGAIGYFPSYVLGNLYAAQIHSTYTKVNPSINKNFDENAFSNINLWLKNNIHKHGKKYSATKIIKKVTGEKLSEKYFLDYLMKKYKDIYYF